jgi:hypothetical protein
VQRLSDSRLGERIGEQSRDIAVLDPAAVEGQNLDHTLTPFRRYYSLDSMRALAI